MTVFRQDRISDIYDYDINNIGGGICLYVNSKYTDFSEIKKNGTTTCKDYEIPNVLISKPTFRNLAIINVYKPPTGKIDNSIVYLKSLFKQVEIAKREIWIIGDFNTDWLKRDSPDTVKMMYFL